MGWKRLSGVEIDVVLYLGVEEDVEEQRGGRGEDRWIDIETLLNGLTTLGIIYSSLHSFSSSCSG
jgi:hypothetical protein